METKLTTEDDGSLTYVRQSDASRRELYAYARHNGGITLEIESKFLATGQERSVLITLDADGVDALEALIKIARSAR